MVPGGLSYPAWESAFWPGPGFAGPAFRSLAADKAEETRW